MPGSMRKGEKKMPKFMKNGKIVGHVQITGVTYDLLQLNRAVWIVDRAKDVSIRSQFKTREALLAKHPNAVFEEEE